MKTLIIVDFQNDFAKPNGSLYVKGAEKAKEEILHYIEQNRNNIYDVIFTVDWHSPNHCSFEKNGGLWPLHCVQFSEGASIDDDIMKLCIDYGIKIKVFIKGNIDDIEEYGAFEYIYHYGCRDGEDVVFATNDANNSSTEFGTFNLVVCGIAGDYCVKSTVENLIKKRECQPIELQVSIFKDGIVSIDGGEKLLNYLKEHPELKIETLTEE